MHKAIGKKGKGCAVYARPNRQRTCTIQQQLEVCQAEAAHRGLHIFPQSVFSDQGFKAFRDLYSRPGFSALMEQARSLNRDFDYVIVDGTNTLSRATSDVLSVFTDLARLGVTLVAVRKPSRAR
jgi:DNA invertase Pin-like site-specific DNA recombinase